MSNFDLRKFLAEGKLYEEATSTEEAMDKPSTKMKMSELKKKIRQEILSELTLNEDDKISVGGAESGGVNTDPVYEATKDGDGEVPSKDTDTDVDIIDKEKVEVDVEKKPKATGVDDDFLDQLEDLQDEAEEIGDNKLERQIANTITYFTRQHIAQDANESIELEEADDMALVADLEAELTEGYNEFKRARKGSKGVTAKNKAEEEVYGAGVKKGEEIEKKKLQKESLEILKMKKLAGLLKEGEYAKALLRENVSEEEVEFNPNDPSTFPSPSTDEIEQMMSGKTPLELLDILHDVFYEYIKINLENTSKEQIHKFLNAVFSQKELGTIEEREVVEYLDLLMELPNFDNKDFDKIFNQKFKSFKENNNPEEDTYGDPYVAANYLYQYNKQFDPFEPQDKKR